MVSTLMALVLWIPHVLALYRALRSTSPALAYFGSVFGVLGLLLVPLGITLLGVAMLGAPLFGKSVGTFSIGLGVLGFIAATSLLATVSPIAVITALSLILFHLIMGWKLYRLSTASQGV